MEAKGKERTDHQSFRHGSTSSAQALDQTETELPFQYSLRPRRDHPHLNPDPAAAVPPVRYGGCLKNHAAKSGRHVLDGCGEFLPSGEDGTPESFKCAACECHRSFHRRESEADVLHHQPRISYGIFNYLYLYSRHRPLFLITKIYRVKN